MVSWNEEKKGEQDIAGKSVKVYATEKSGIKKKTKKKNEETGMHFFFFENKKEKEQEKW